MEWQREQDQKTEAKQRRDWYCTCLELTSLTPDDINRIVDEEEKREEAIQNEFRKNLKEVLKSIRGLAIIYLGTILCLWSGIEMGSCMLFILALFMTLRFLLIYLPFLQNLTEWL